MNKNQTKAERREAARERARKLAAAEAKKAQRTKIYTIAGIVAAIAIVAFAIYAIVSNSSKNDAVEYEPPLVTVAETTSDSGVADGYAVTAEGVTPKDDAKTVSLYFDYMCVHCSNLESTYGYQISDMVEKGDMKLEIHPVAIINSNFSKIGAQAFHYVAENSPEHLMKFHKELFDMSAQIFAGTSSTEPQWAQIVEAAKNAGVPAEVADAMEAGADQAWVDGATEAFRAKYTGTPTVLVDGEESVAWADGGFYSMLGIEDPNN